jgi:hypothetical protein
MVGTATAARSSSLHLAGYLAESIAHVAADVAAVIAKRIHHISHPTQGIGHLVMQAHPPIAATAARPAAFKRVREEIKSRSRTGSTREERV